MTLHAALGNVSAVVSGRQEVLRSTPNRIFNVSRQERCALMKRTGKLRCRLLERPLAEPFLTVFAQMGIGVPG
jgi:hypothetical protein